MRQSTELRELRKFVKDICEVLSVTEPLGERTLYETICVIVKGNRDGLRAWHLQYQQANNKFNDANRELQTVRQELEKVKAQHERDKIKTDWAKFQEFEKSVLERVSKVRAVQEAATSYRELYERCIFCGSDNYGSSLKHKPDCVWIEAQEFLKDRIS